MAQSPTHIYVKQFLIVSTLGTLGGIILLGGTVPCIVRSLAVSQASAHLMSSSTPPPLVTTKNVLTLTNVPWGKIYQWGPNNIKPHGLNIIFCCSVKNPF